MTGRFSVLEVSVPYRLQRERAAPHPAEVQARPLAPDRPASVLGQVVDELQRTAGNGAVRRLVQRQADPAMTPATPGLPPEQERQLLAASTTLRRVPPLAEPARADLNRIVGGAPVVAWLAERDRKREQLATRTHDLEFMRDQQAHPPENGTPPMRQEVDAVAQEVDGLTTDVQQLSDRITAALGPLGVSDEAELRTLVNNRFPDMFIERAKQVAGAELDQNQELVNQEAQRYGVDACVDPTARNALTAAAVDLRTRDAEIVRLREAVDQVRGSVDLPSGGVPDPDQMGSSYLDLQTRQSAYDEAVSQRNQARDRYALQHPVLLRPDVDLDVLASGDPDRIGTYLGGTFTEISNNIRDTRDNIKSGALKVWNLTNVVAMTAQDLGIAGNETLEAAVRSYIANAQTDENVLRIGLAALAITAGIIAAVGSGGLALAAGGVALGAGGINAAGSVRDYLAASAAGNVALDPAVARLGAEEPSLFWLLLDIVGMVADAVQVVRVFNQMRAAALALRTTGDVAGFERAARAALPPDQAERLVASAVTRNAAPGAATAPAAPVPWEDLLARVEEPTARQSVGGFRSQPIRVGNREVVAVEGVVGEQLPQSESLAHYTPTHPNEHATHAVGMQLGENLPESITSAPGAGLNLSSMKSVENAIRKTAERAAESGGVVETQTITMIEYVGAEQVPTMVGVERKAWLRMAGSDQPVRFVDFKASVDPVTRQVTVLRNEIGGGRVPAAR